MSARSWHARRENAEMLKTKLLGALAIAVSSLGACREEEPTGPRRHDPESAARTPFNPALLARGQEIFRFDTYGDETFWTDTLRLHEVIRASVSPTAAL